MRGANSERVATSCGMTIVEAVVALLLFGIFIGTACRVLLSTRESAGRARDHYQAICLGKNRIERLQSVDFSQLASCRTTGEVMDQEGLPTPYGNFKMSVTVTNVTANLMWVLVTVEIKDRETLQFDGELEEIATMLSEQRARPQ